MKIIEGLFGVYVNLQGLTNHIDSAFLYTMRCKVHPSSILLVLLFLAWQFIPIHLQVYGSSIFRVDHLILHLRIFSGIVRSVYAPLSFLTKED